MNNTTNTASATHELWHKTTAGTAVSQGFMMRGTKDEVTEASEREYVVRDGAMFTLHMVPIGSYDGYPQPDLGDHNECDSLDNSETQYETIY